MSNTENTTHFGNKTILKELKSEMVGDVFTNVAKKYDLMNDFMSLGIHRIWKTALIDWLSPRNGQELLDVAGGTGDIAFRILKRAPKSRVTVLDMTEKMLVEGKKRAEAQEFKGNIDWICADAMTLPFKENSFDSALINIDSTIGKRIFRDNKNFISLSSNQSNSDIFLDYKILMLFPSEILLVVPYYICDLSNQYQKKFDT